MKKRFYRRGYFFTLDAIMALSVLSIGLFLIFSANSSVPRKEQVSFHSKELLDFFADTKIEDINNEYVGIGGQLWNSGQITDSSSTLLQEIGKFYALGSQDISEKIVTNVTTGIIPDQFLFEVWIDNTRVYPQTQTPENIISKNETELLLSSRKIVQGFTNPENGSLYGPYVAEVLAWQNS